MNLGADMGRHSGRATPSLHDAPYRQFKEATGRRPTYSLPIPVQTNRATSLDGCEEVIVAFVVTGCNGTEVLDFAEEAFDEVAIFVEKMAEGGLDFAPGHRFDRVCDVSLPHEDPVSSYGTSGHPDTPTRQSLHR